MKVMHPARFTSNMGNILSFSEEDQQGSFQRQSDSIGNFALAFKNSNQRDSVPITMQRSQSARTVIETQTPIKRGK